MELKLTSVREEKIQEYLEKLRNYFKITQVQGAVSPYYIIELCYITDISLIIDTLKYGVVIEEGVLAPLNLTIYDDYME